MGNRITNSNKWKKKLQNTSEIIEYGTMVRHHQWMYRENSNAAIHGALEFIDEKYGYSSTSVDDMWHWHGEVKDGYMWNLGKKRYKSICKYFDNWLECLKTRNPEAELPEPMQVYKRIIDAEYDRSLMVVTDNDRDYIALAFSDNTSYWIDRDRGEILTHFFQPTVDMGYHGSYKEYNYNYSETMFGMMRRAVKALKNIYYANLPKFIEMSISDKNEILDHWCGNDGNHIPDDRYPEYIRRCKFIAKCWEQCSNIEMDNELKYEYIRRCLLTYDKEMRSMWGRGQWSYKSFREYENIKPLPIEQFIQRTRCNNPDYDSSWLDNDRWRWEKEND